MTVKPQSSGDGVRGAEQRQPEQPVILDAMAMSLEARTKRANHKEFVGQNLVDARKAVGLKQAQLARKLGITPNKLNQWEAGLYYPDPWLLKQLCEDYGFTMDWFYRRIRAGVSSERVDDLRRVEEEAEAA
jgi:DNA-binding transcriptional regulator YiaG